MKYAAALLILASCASSPDKRPVKAPQNISNEAFKKEKPLTSAQITDFYQNGVPSLSPALQDETTDRYSEAELSKMNTSADPLLAMSVRCKQGEFNTAFEIASETYDRYQKIAPYWNQIANCHLNAGSFRKALLFYNKALEVKPDYVPALNNIGVMYTRQDQDQKAIIAFERANKQAKFSKTPRYNLAKLYLTYGLAEQALPIFLSLLNEAPKDADLLNAAASSYFVLSDYQKAAGLYQNIPKTEWKKAEVGLNFALTLKKLGRVQDAKKVFNIVETPKNGNLKRYYASVEGQLGDAE